MSHSVEVPKPPEDPEMRNIIDKLAQFVAKNGPEFENMTKQKQKENPRFGFLYGGEYFYYYTYRVNVEQAVGRKRQQSDQQCPPQNVQMLQAQISESEKNLKAQYEVLRQQQETEINDAIRVALERQICQVALELRLNITELGSILDGLAYPYAQEGQEAAANWIFAHYATPKHGELLIRYLLERIKDPREYFQRKLSILHLITSVIQRSIREKNEHMVALLNRFAPIMTSVVWKHHCQQDDRASAELDQLLRVWSQQRLLGEIAEWRCSNAEETISQYQNELRNEYADIVGEVTSRIQAQYRQYEMQHHEYTRHIQQQIASQQYQQQPATSVIAPQMQQQHQQPDTSVASQQQQQQPKTQPRRSRFDDAGPARPVSQPPPPAVVNPVAPGPPGVSPWQQPPPMIAAAITSRPTPAHAPFPGQQWPPHSQPLWMSAPPGPTPTAPFGPALPPPTSKPLIPTPAAVDEQSLLPKVAYYDLPAALMVPLIKMEDHDYKPVKPADLRLPPPTPPSERLIAAVDAFYAPPNHENPRDSDGWERLGLYEYYKEKARAIRRNVSMGKDNSGDESS